VVIGHRLSTVIRADRVLVIHDGELVESGTHEELWARRGRYHSLFRASADDELYVLAGRAAAEA
jgi:ABC-type multidrug transport system fused ATPase/permease subunit